MVSKAYVSWTRRGCLAAAALLTGVATVLALVALLSPVWLRVSANPSAATAAAFGGFVPAAGGDNGGGRTVGIFDDCITTLTLERVCDKRYAPFNGDGQGRRNAVLLAQQQQQQQQGRFGLQNTAGLNLNGAQNGVDTEWRAALFYLLCAAILCGVESVQLSLCAVKLAAVSVAWTVFTLLTWILLLSAVLVFNGRYEEIVRLDAARAAGQQQQAAGAFNRQLAGQLGVGQYDTGAAYGSAVWSCVLAALALLLSVVATALALVQHFGNGGRRHKIAVLGLGDI